MNFRFIVHVFHIHAVLKAHGLKCQNIVLTLSLFLGSKLACASPLHLTISKQSSTFQWEVVLRIFCRKISSQSLLGEMNSVNLISAFQLKIMA